MSDMMEEFPSLPTTKQKFEIRKDGYSMARSSASTTSIGATESELRYKLTPGDYMIMDSFNLRPKLYCTCRNCQTRYPTASNFGECENAISLSHSEFKCRVTDSKIINHPTEKFSVSYIRSAATMCDDKSGEDLGRLRGWVKSKYLRPVISASKSVAPAFRFHREVDRSRSPSVFFESHFRFGDLVLVNTGRDNWVRGEVRQENPMLILVEGTTTPQPFHISSVKDHPTRQFVAAKELSVRRNKFRGDWGVQTVKVGTTISVAYMDGSEGRITAPFQGWVTMRDSLHSDLNVVDAEWTCTTKDLSPTMIVTNLPDSITENSLRRHLLMKCYLKVKTIVFQRRGDQFRAVVTFAESFKAVSRAVEKGSSEFQYGWNITLKWDMAHLKNRARTIVNRRLNKQTKI